ncbi:MAG: N-acetylmuramoyl-L-alanine amidase [Oscillospiraceae bacterium]|nr:N-acetylmuramoyl-L-alanine amidase [Oscillospiraceae bacterium]
MKGKAYAKTLLPVYLLSVLFVLLIAFTGSRAITTIALETPKQGRRCIVIDPGHGGVDGGATSCSGVLESGINLEIAMRLNELMHLLGYETVMIRTSDVSVYTQGETIAQKKVSDLKHRVEIVKEQKDPVLISIHQNYFPDSQYSGAQVFYPTTYESDRLAQILQKNLISVLDRESKRKCKPAHGIYLMEHIECTGSLIECGFLSNPEEEARLRAGEYQKALCAVIGASVSQFLNA